MVDAPPHSTLRDMRDHVWNIRTLAVLLLVGGGLTLVAPFGTGRALTLLPLAGFWIGIVALTYTLGLAVHMGLAAHLRGLPSGLRIVISAVVTGLVIAVALHVLTSVIFGNPPSIRDALTDIGRDFGIGVIVSLALQIGAGGAEAPPPASPTNVTPPLLDRLPLDKRGPLLSLSVEDHYVRVRTTKGEQMLLMRLGDAIREAAPTPGLKVHRSHWVAMDAVTAARRDGDRAILTLSQGGDIPASRSHIPALKDAGLLPR
ncbi:MAG: LytTR family DNA-binding domain-containing protein [Pseudomonadota bacterium]